MSNSPSSYQSAAQIVSGYLAMVNRPPRDKRLDALAEILPLVTESEIRSPLLREFNNLSERTAR